MYSTILQFSRSNMFQHGVRIFLDDYLAIESIDTPHEEAQREYMEDFLYWMRTVWQHIVSHYVSNCFTLLLFAETCFIFWIFILYLLLLTFYLLKCTNKDNHVCMYRYVCYLYL
jgi:hypothetical protein